MYALKRQEREEITERTRLMTVPLSVSNISGTAFVSATSAVRSHGHRRRYLKKRGNTKREREREKELQLQFVSDGKEKIKRRNAMNAFRTTHKKRKKKKKKTKKNRKKNLTRRPNGSCSDTETAEENRTKDTSIRKSFS